MFGNIRLGFVVWAISFGVSGLAETPAAGVNPCAIPWSTTAHFNAQCTICKKYPLKGTGGMDDSLTSRVSKLNSEMVSREYQAKDLVNIPLSYTNPESLAARGATGFEQMRKDAASAVLRMIDSARAQGVEIVVDSAYRSYSIQCYLFNHKVGMEAMGIPELAANAALAATNVNSCLVSRNETPLKTDVAPPMDEDAAIVDVNNRSAFPGHSEHQLGTAVDLTTNIPCLGYKLEIPFENTPASAWLRRNAKNFGFAMSYPAETPGAESPNPNPVTGYMYEPWHWRYIGVQTAQDYAACKGDDAILMKYLRHLQAQPKFRCAR